MDLTPKLLRLEEAKTQVGVRFAIQKIGSDKQPK
jgi:hypothetical protein